MHSLKWKRWIGNCFFLKNPADRKIILLYHAVGSGIKSMSATQFYAQIKLLHEHALIMPLTALLAAPSDDQLKVAITFDDGYACLYDKVMPILQAFNASATVYLNTGWLADDATERKASNETLGHYPDECFLIWPEVQQLVANGWEIGSHGVNHLDFSQAPASVVQKELIDSKLKIERQLDLPCRQFAYTWGKYNARLKKQLISTGYQQALSVDHGPVTARSDRYVLPRMNVANEYSLADFKKLLNGQWDFIGFIQRIKKFL